MLFCRRVKITDKQKEGSPPCPGFRQLVLRARAQSLAVLFLGLAHWGLAHCEEPVSAASPYCLSQAATARHARVAFMRPRPSAWLGWTVWTSTLCGLWPLDYISFAFL